MKLALVGISHHSAPVELRERVAVDRGRRRVARPGALRRAARPSCSRPATAPSSTSPRTATPTSTGGRTLRCSASQARSPGARTRALPPRGRVRRAAPVPGRGRAGLDGAGRGRDPRAGSRRVRDRRDRASARPPLPHGAARRSPRARRDVDRREPGIRPGGGRGPRPAGLRRPRGPQGRPRRSGADERPDCPEPPLSRRRVAAVANRTVEHGDALAAQARCPGGHPRARFAAEVADADIVVASTSAPGFVLIGEDLAGALRSRRGRPVLFVDLAVPRDVDPSLATFDGCFVYDVDDLEAVVATSLAGRRTEAVGRSASSQPRPTASGSGRHRWRSSRRSRRCVPTPRRSARQSSPGSRPGSAASPRASAASWRR